MGSLTYRAYSTLVNNAFWTEGGPALDLTPEDITKCFEVSVFGTLYMIQAVVPHMPRGGRVINIGSIGSRTGFSGTPVYNATKAANDALTYSMASEVSQTIFVAMCNCT